MCENACAPTVCFGTCMDYACLFTVCFSGSWFACAVWLKLFSLPRLKLTAFMQMKTVTNNLHIGYNW
jgi:hypothetical protein